MKPIKLNFKDGSSLEILENGAYALRETKTVNHLMAFHWCRARGYGEDKGHESFGLAMPA